MDFHDASVVLSILRWIGQLSTMSGTELTALKNEQIRHSLDQKIPAEEDAWPSCASTPHLHASSDLGEPPKI